MIGDVEEDQVIEVMKDLPFENRPEKDLSVFYRQDLENIIREKKSSESLCRIQKKQLRLSYGCLL